LRGGAIFTRIASRIRKFVGPVVRDTGGAAAVFIAIGLIPLIGASGLAVDSARGYLLKSRLSKSLDTAGLASGRAALNGNAPQIAREYFDINFGDSGNITLD
jgi:Flp pilus assembly protein TadG